MARAARPTPPKRPPPKRPPPREQALAPHLSAPLEAPWARAYQATLTTLTRRLGATLAGFASPPPRP